MKKLLTLSPMSRLCRALLLTTLAAGATTALADTPDPIIEATKIELQVNNDYTITATVSGKWQWTTHRKDCNTDRFGVGWAVDWHDPSQPGNYVGTVNNVPVHVGAQFGNSRNPADNEVDFYPGPNPARCGVYARHGASSYNTGDWGPVSHTYKDFDDLAKASVCVVMYDLHNGKGKRGHGKHGSMGMQIKDGDLKAGGDDHNHDNSVQDNANTPLGNQCIPIPLGQIPTKR